jgi:HEAT repeat protein
MDDPVYARWKRRHPKFPGVTKCVALLGRRNVTGGLVDIISGELQANATAHATELIAAFRAELDGRVRSILLSIICEARLEEALPVLVEHLRSDDARLRHWAAEGLRRLDTHVARKALSNAGYRLRTDSLR